MIQLMLKNNPIDNTYAINRFHALLAGRVPKGVVSMTVRHVFLFSMSKM